MQVLEGQRLPWKRWWTLEGANPPVSGGILEDPAARYGRWLAKGLVGLEAYQGTRCIVLLGEPGSGKSDELVEEQARWGESGTAKFLVDLGAHGDRHALDEALFDAPEIREWRDGQGEVVLLLDGFDEAQGDIRKLTEDLLRWFAKLPLDRLRVRITSRPAVWPQRFTTGLRALWPASTEVLVLAPLTEADIRLAATHALPDGDAFMRSVRQYDIGALAARPVTLDMLLLAAKQGPLPRDRTALYRNGVRALAVENHARRLEDGHAGPPVDRRVRAAEILATISLLSGAPAIGRRRTATTPTEALTLDDAITASVSMEDLEAVWDSALLVAAAGDRQSWAHRSIAEYLCGQLLAGLPVKTIRYLLIAQGSDPGIVPHLAGVAAWVAFLNEEIFEWLAEFEPDILLTAGLATAAPRQRRRLAQRLFAQLSDGIPSGDFRSYAVLDYPELAADLAGLLEPSRPVWVRTEALHVLAATDRHEHDVLLMELIEDVAARYGPDSYDDEVALADGAVYVLRGTADEGLRQRARIVLFDRTAPETLRGRLADLIAADVDVPTLLRSMEPDLLGRPRSALARTATERLVAELDAGTVNPSVVVGWLGGLPPEARVSDLYEEVVAATVRALAANDLDDPTWVTLGRLATEHAKDSNDLFGLGPAATVTLSVANRRRLVLESLRHSDDEMLTAYALQGAGLLPDEDCEYWLTALADAAAGGDTKADAVAQGAVYGLDHSSVANHETAARVVAERPELADWYAVWSAPPRPRRRAPTPKPKPAPGDERAYFSLDRLQAAVSTGDWQAVRTELTRAVAGDPPEQFVFWTPLSTGPAWRCLPPATRDAVIDLAESYLAGLPGEVTTFDADRFADAYALLIHAAPSRVEAIDPMTLLPWLPALFDTPDRGSTFEHLAVAAGRVAPGEVERVVVAAIKKDAHASSHAARIEMLGSYTTPAVEDELAAMIAAPTTTPEALEGIIEALLRRDSVRATRLSLEVLDERPRTRPTGEPGSDAEDGDEQEDTQRVRQAVRWQRAVAAATALTRGAGADERFDAFFAAMQASTDFAMDVVAWSRHTLRPAAWNGPTSDQLATLYLWARIALPQPKARPPGVVVGVHPVEDFTGAVYRELTARVDEAAIAALERVADEGNDPWARASAAELRAALRRQTWSPLSPADIQAIVADPARRAVRTESELADVLLEAIDRLSDEIRDNPDVRQLFWHRQAGKPATFIPASELEFTTRMVDRLQPALERVVLRQEVKLHGRLGNEAASFPDFEAIVHQPDGDEVVVVGEVKGNWHTEVGTAIEDQLVERYLETPRTSTGIYVVAWYEGDLWAEENRRTAARRQVRVSLAARLQATASRLSRPGRAVHVRVVDLTLNAQDRDPVEDDDTTEEAESEVVVTDPPAP